MATGVSVIPDLYLDYNNLEPAWCTAAVRKMISFITVLSQLFRTSDPFQVFSQSYFALAVSLKNELDVWFMVDWCRI